VQALESRVQNINNMMMTYSVAVLAAFGVRYASGLPAAPDCTGIMVCAEGRKRILFIVDASESVGQAQFDTKMSEYLLKTVACGFKNASANTIEAGLITFNSRIEDKIPLEFTNANNWASDIENKVRGRSNTVLRCCTSHAEAAIRAKELFLLKHQEDIDNQVSTPQEIAYFLTDGIPYANMAVDGRFAIKSDRVARAFYSDRNLDYRDWTLGKPQFRSQQKANYAATKVTLHIQNLINLGIRVFFVGVPNQGGREIPFEMFKGQTTEVCYNTPGQSSSCATLDPPGALVSEPVDDHAFGVDYNDVNAAAQLSLEKLCRVWMPPTRTPTVAPSSPPVTLAPQPAACQRGETDLLILVDTSESMDQLRFENEMMTVIKQAARVVGESGGRVAVATFGSAENTNVRIPFHTVTDWVAFDTMVDTRIKTAPLACCTNLAEAYSMAELYFHRRSPSRSKSVLVVGDGTPFQNFGKKKWNWRANKRHKNTRCFYTARIVPNQAKLLSRTGVTIAFIGVPNIDDRRAYMDFVRGDFRQDIAGAKVSCCSNIDTNDSCLKVVDGVIDPEWCSSTFDQQAPTKCIKYRTHRIVSGNSGSTDMAFQMSGWGSNDIASIGNSWRASYCLL